MATLFMSGSFFEADEDIDRRQEPEALNCHQRDQRECCGYPAVGRPVKCGIADLDCEEPARRAGNDGNRRH